MTTQSQHYQKGKEIPAVFFEVRVIDTFEHHREKIPANGVDKYLQDLESETKAITSGGQGVPSKKSCQNWKGIRRPGTSGTDRAADVQQPERGQLEDEEAPNKK